MSCGCTRMRASIVGCRVLDRCGDSLGHGITIIYTTNKDGESIDWQWVRRVNVWLCSGMFMALRTLRGLSSIRAPVRHLFYALTHTSHFYAQPDLNVLYQAQCRPEGRAWGRGPGWEEKPLINRVAPRAVAVLHEVHS